MAYIRIFIFTTFCLCTFAVPHHKDDEKHRIPRSTFFIGAPPGPPGPPGPPPPPPPPIFFRSNNWSGFARSSDGAPQGVISGAAAAAESSAPAFGTAGAYSVASSGGSDGSENSYGDQSGGACCGNLQTQQSGGSGFGSNSGGYAGDKSSQYSQQSLSNTQGSNGDRSADFNNGQSNFGGQKSGFKESHFSYKSSGGHSDGHSSNFKGGSSGSDGSQLQSASYKSSSNSFNNGNSDGGANRQQFSRSGGFNNDQSSRDELTQQQSGGFGSSGSGPHGAASSLASSGSYGGGHFNEGQVQHTSFESSNSANNGVGLSQQQTTGFGSNGGSGHGPVNSKLNSGSFGSSQYGEKYQQSSFGNDGAGFLQGPSHGLSEKSSGHYGASSELEGGQRQSSSFGNSGGIQHKVEFSNEQSLSAGGGHGDYNTQRGFSGNGQQHAQSGSELSRNLHGPGDGQFGVDTGLTQQSGFERSSALSGAFNLAAQGLESSKDISGCSTCGKGGFALSNAKAHTGNAVALSIGG